MHPSAVSVDIHADPWRPDLDDSRSGPFRHVRTDCVVAPKVRIFDEIDDIAPEENDPSLGFVPGLD